MARSAIVAPVLLVFGSGCGASLGGPIAQFRRAASSKFVLDALGNHLAHGLIDLSKQDQIDGGHRDRGRCRLE